jgi:hypothetical protein
VATDRGVQAFVQQHEDKIGVGASVELNPSFTTVALN